MLVHLPGLDHEVMDPTPRVMSAFPLGRRQIRRSGYGAMPLAGSFAFGTPPDRACAIGVLRTAVAAGADHIDTAQYWASQLAAVNLRLPGDGRIGARFDDQLATMVAARDEGLIAGIGLSNVSLQNLFHLADRRDTPLLRESLSRGIAFVPFCPLGWPRGPENPVLTSPAVLQTAARLQVTPAQVALQWLLQLAPNVLLIPGTGTVAHLRENLAAEDLTLDPQALRDLAAL
jgi:pyridoxine 4-dehydrogenase